MFDMNWKIKVGRFQLKMIESVEIVRSVEMLADTATITLPATAYNVALDIEDKIKRGDTVTIELGYDNVLQMEFNGYLNSISTDGGSLKFECEDGLFKYRKSLVNTELKNTSVNDVLNYVDSKIGGFTLKCDYEFKYDKFVINNATGYDVLKKIQEETKANIYLKGNVLHIHPQYSELFGAEKYDFSVNIESDDLKYKRADERKVMVTVEYTGKDGKTKKIEFGDTGGERVDVKGGTTDINSLMLKAKQEYVSRVYEGYEGTFTGWLIPFCDAGYKVDVIDKDYEKKNGTYYVLEVKVNFSKSGGSRTIKIGKKLGDIKKS